MIIIIIQNNLRSSIICCLFSGGIYISSGLFIFSFSFGLPIEVVLSAILLPIKYPVASAVFCATLLEAVFAASIRVFVAVSINFYHSYLQIFSKRQKSVSFYVFSKSRFC